MAQISDLIGQEGVDLITDTGAHTPGNSRSSWTLVKAINGAAVVASITLADASENGTGTSVTETAISLPDQGTIHGAITGITLTSGKVLCYRSAR